MKTRKQRIRNPLAVLAAATLVSAVSASEAAAQLPDPGMTVDGSTAVVVTDPQIDFLSPKGVTWEVVGKSVEKNNTVANLGRLMAAAKQHNVPLFVSPHYYYPHDHKWRFGGAVEVLMHKIKMFDRKNPLSLRGFKNSGADWLPRYKNLINDGKTVVTSPHKVYGPDSNDLVLQLRKRGINKVILAGMSANLCVESHLRELLEQGFEVVVVTDATAAAQVPGFDGYKAAITNFRFIANDLWTAAEAVEKLAEVRTARR
ncbi:MAG: cysteine hydrolase [Proteobacteria bacterium]|nr:cysteine hydrolase [Pseudomonadota bacterium]